MTKDPDWFFEPRLRFGIRTTASTRRLGTLPWPRRASVRTRSHQPSTGGKQTRSPCRRG